MEVLKAFQTYGWWGVVVIVVGYLGYEGYKALLKRVVAQASETARVALTERKAELDRYAEHLKHRMARDLLQAELRARSLYRIYPRLTEKWHWAASAIDDLFKNRAYPLFFNATRDQFITYVRNEKFPGDRETRIISEFDRDRSAAGSLLVNEIGRRRLGDATKLLDDASPFFLLNRLYCSDDVIAAVEKLDDLLRVLLSE